ncbi:hypothetical protein [Epilithonimonas caeni]|uniref:hypothetical protein n=1 Tax=Epilithonimonas caeni TaxID=365343 RepID=UPI000487F3A9|nr:hypothetical protein [Epilithonimonas caeni]
MKKSLLSTFILVYSCSFSQVAIGKTVLESASSSIEFGTENRGLVLPWVTSASVVSGVVNGTMIFDLNDKKVKVYESNAWKDLSINSDGTADTTLQDGLVEETAAKVSFGTVTSTPGILVLEDTNRAMILPKVADPHLNIVSPTPGMIVYDTTKKMLAVFNGAVWTFWKAS